MVNDPVFDDYRPNNPYFQILLNDALMKKFFIYILLFFALTTTTHAQMTKGTVLTGIDLGTSTSESESSSPYDYKITGLQVTPTIGFVIKDNVLIGFSVSYGHYGDEYETTSTTTDNYGAAAYYRRYISLGKKFFLFGQARTGYGVMEREEILERGRVNRRQSTVSLSLSPGLAYTLTKRFQLETGIGSVLGVDYHWDESKNSFPGGQYESKRSGISFSANANPRSELYIGIRLALGR